MTASAYMVDWLTVELPDPVGLPVNAGEIVRISREGEVEWATPARLQVEGSWASSMVFRAIGSPDQHRAWLDGSPATLDGSQPTLVVSGNPAKFLNGHNLFGTADVAALLDGVVTRARSAMWPDLFEQPRIDYGEGRISRIDLTCSWLLDRATDVLPYLQAMEQTIWCPYRSRGVFDAGGSTLYYGRTDKGKRAKDWALKLYWKGPEVIAHPLPQPAYEVPGLMDDLNRTIRVELTLRTAELKRLNLLHVKDWTPDKVAEIWELYMSKLNLTQTSVNLESVDLAELGLKGRHADAIASWKAGNDLRAGRSRASFYRLRKEIRDLTGHDIAGLCPKSNVVPLRRLVTVTPAQHPRWADQLTAALGVAA